MLSREALMTWTGAPAPRNNRSNHGKYSQLPPPLPPMFSLKQKSDGDKKDSSGGRRKSRIVQTEPRMIHTQPRIIHNSKARLPATEHTISSSTTKSKEMISKSFEENQLITRKKQEEKLLSETMTHNFHDGSIAKSTQSPLTSLQKARVPTGKAQTDSEIALKYKKAKENWRETLRNARKKEQRLEKELAELRRSNEEKDNLLTKTNHLEICKVNSELEEKVSTLQLELIEKDKIIDRLNKENEEHQSLIMNMNKDFNTIKDEKEKIVEENNELKGVKEDLIIFLEENLVGFQKNKEIMLHKIDEMNGEFEEERGTLLKEIEGYKIEVKSLEESVEKEIQKRRHERVKFKTIFKKNLGTIESLEKEVHGLNKSKDELKERLRQEMERNVSNFSRTFKNGTSNGNSRPEIADIELVVVNDDNRTENHHSEGAPNDEKQSSGSRFRKSKKKDGDISGAKPDKRC